MDCHFWAGKCVRIDKNTKMVDLEVRLPVSSPTSLTFCGKDCKTLVITTRKKENRKDGVRCSRCAHSGYRRFTGTRVWQFTNHRSRRIQRGGMNRYSSYNNMNNNTNNNTNRKKHEQRPRRVYGRRVEGTPPTALTTSAVSLTA